MSKFYIEKFEEKLNANRDLLCFGANVYDLKANEWRETKPEDYCSISTGYEREEVKEDNEKIFYKIVGDMLPDAERLKFTLQRIALSLSGNPTQHFNIWQGTGANGKSVLASYMQAIFGDYYAEANPSLITGTRAKSNEATDDLCKIRYSRVVVFSEPEKGKKLNNAIIKQFSGQDEIQARGLFKSGFRYKPQFQCFILCNTFEMEDIEDNSIPRRLIYTKFKTSFVENPKLDFERKADDKITKSEFIEKIRGGAMSALLKLWREMSEINFKIKMPASMEHDKTEFIDDNNDIKQFIIETYEQTDDENQFVQFKDIKQEYKLFCKEHGHTIKKDKELLRRLSNDMRGYVARHRPYVDKVRQPEIRNVFKQWKRIEG